MLFWWICGGESVLPVLLLRHLGSSSIYMLYYVMFAFLLLTYFTLYNRLWFIHFTRTDSNFFLFMAEEHSIEYMYHNFFTHSSISEHRSWFQVLVIVNSAAINTGIHAFFELWVSQSICPVVIALIIFKCLEISSRKSEIPRNISCKDGLNKGQKWYGPNRSRRY